LADYRCYSTNGFCLDHRNVPCLTGSVCDNAFHKAHPTESPCIDPSESYGCVGHQGTNFQCIKGAGLQGISACKSSCINHHSERVFGISFTGPWGGTKLLNIDERTGKISNLDHNTTIKPQESAQAQGLSAIDRGNGIFYIIGLNESSRQVQLMGFDTVHGDLTVNVPLPFDDLAFVGLGQAVDVDPNTGDVIAIGQAQTVEMHHEVLHLFVILL
jgi:hypothetical protein